VFPAWLKILGFQKRNTIKMVTVPFLISTAPPKGDINGDIKVDLADAILALKVMAGLDSSEVSFLKLLPARERKRRLGGCRVGEKDRLRQQGVRC